MNLPPGTIWSPGEAAALNEFLNTPVGRKWLGILLNRKPEVKLDSTEQAALTGAQAAGYEKVFLEISALRTTLPPEPAGLKSIDPTRD